jgi:hypothetical protein
MSIFDEREREFEAKFKHDEELRFKMTMRRDKLLGQWAAAQLGLSGKAAEDYVHAVMDKVFERTGGGAMIEMLLADFKSRGLAIAPHDIERRLAELGIEARRQVMVEVKPEG